MEPFSGFCHWCRVTKVFVKWGYHILKLNYHYGPFQGYCCSYWKNGNYFLFLYGFFLHLWFKDNQNDSVTILFPYVACDMALSFFFKFKFLFHGGLNWRVIWNCFHIGFIWGKSCLGFVLYSPIHCQPCSLERFVALVFSFFLLIFSSLPNKVCCPMYLNFRFN